MYLCDDRIVQDKHRNILRAAMLEVIDLITGSSVNTPPYQECLLSIIMDEERKERTDIARVT